MPSSNSPAAKMAAEEARKTPLTRILYAEGGGYYADCTHCDWHESGPLDTALDEAAVKHLRETHGIQTKTRLQKQIDRLAAGRRV